MQRLKTVLLDWMVYAGVTPEEYRELRGVIREKDRETLVLASLLAGLLLMGLFLFSFASAAIAGNRTLYGVFVLLTLGLFLITRGWLSRHPGLVLAACHLFLALVFGFALLLSTISQNTVPATTFCVLLVAAPLLFIEQPWRISLLAAVMTVAFCICSAYVKLPAHAALDVVNSVSFLLLGTAINASVTRAKLRDLIQRRYIEREKDTDSLTGLLTKAAAERKMQEYIASGSEQAALLILDVDNFKRVNDTYGHAYGDLTLRLIGECIRGTFRATDSMGRFGGDEFVIFLPGVKDRRAVETRVDRLLSEVDSTLRLPGQETSIGCSVGIAFYPGDGADYETLFHQADQALYTAKRQGKNRWAAAAEEA